MRRILLVFIAMAVMAAMMAAMAMPAFAKQNCNADFSVCSGGDGEGGSGLLGGGGGGHTVNDGTTNTASGGGGSRGGGFGFSQTLDLSTQEYARQGSDNSRFDGPSGPGRCSGTFPNEIDCVGKNETHPAS